MFIGWNFKPWNRWKGKIIFLASPFLSLIKLFASLFSLQMLHICPHYMSSELLYPLGWIVFWLVLQRTPLNSNNSGGVFSSYSDEFSVEKSVIWVVYGQQKCIIRNVISLVEVVTVRKFDIYYLYRIIILHTSLVGLPKKIRKHWCLLNQFSVKFKIRKAGKMSTIFILHPKICSQR